MSLFSNFGKRLPGLTLIMITILSLFPLSGLWPDSVFKKPCTLLPSIVNVQVNGLPATFQPPKPILVKPGDLVTVSARIKTKQEICYGTPSTEWRLAFTSGLTQVYTTSEIKQGSLEFFVNEHLSGDNLVTLTVRAPEGDSQRVYFLFTVVGN